MKFVKGIILMLALACVTASLGFAQGTTNNPSCPAGAASCSGAVGVGSSIVYNNLGGNGKMVASAIPGTTESVFPVGIIMLGKQQCSLMNGPNSLMNYGELDNDQLASMAAGIKVSKNDMDVRLISPQLVEREDGKSIRFVDWWPLLHGYRFPKDAVVAITAIRESVHSKRLQLDDAYMAKATMLARAASGSHRMAALVCQQDVGKTSNATVGLGVTIANASASNPTTTTMGFGHGSGDSWMGELPAVYVVALNDYEGEPYTQYAPKQPNQEKKPDADKKPDVPTQKQPDPPAQTQQPQAAAQPVPQPQATPTSIVIEKLEVIMPATHNSGAGHRKAATPASNVTNNYNVTNTVAQPACPTVGSFFCWTWPWHMWSWLWQLLGLLLLIALLLIAINWIVRRAIRNVPADATFELIEARTTVAERNLSEVIHRSETRVIEAGRLSAQQLGDRADAAIAAWKARQKTTKK